MLKSGHWKRKVLGQGCTTGSKSAYPEWTRSWLVDWTWVFWNNVILENFIKISLILKIFEILFMGWKWNRGGQWRLRWTSRGTEGDQKWIGKGPMFYCFFFLNLQTGEMIAWFQNYTGSGSGCRLEFIYKWLAFLSTFYINF